MSVMIMIYGSVCSGIEAATVAWHSLGWRPSFFSEIDPFPRAVLSYHYPAVPLHGDFATIRKNYYAAIDLLVGGTPCQSFSVAGLRKGLDDKRGLLAIEYLRLADRLGPRWLVWENVPGVLSANRGRDFGSFLGGLVELGYGFAYRVLDAQYFGVPQRRRRVFVVGYLGDWRPAAAVLFEREGLRRDSSPAGREERQSAANDNAAIGCWWDGGDLSQTLDAVLYKKQALPEKNRFPAVVVDGRLRYITSRESERLQGFPDDYTLIPWRGKPADQCPDGPRYKAIGNSMAVPVMRWIGERIQMVDALVPRPANANTRQPANDN